MADTAVAADAPAPATPSKKPTKSAAGGSSKKPKAKPTHPKTSEMVNSAIKELKERSGSSLQAIKKYIAAQYKVDAEKLAPFIRKYLKSAVESGALIQTKGKGASGSFKLESKSSSGASAKKSAAATSKKTPASRKSATKTPVKSKRSPLKAKPAGAAAKPKDKKVAATKKKQPAPRKSSSTPAKSKSAPKAKKSAKLPTKPRAPKPKKAAPKPKAAAVKKAGKK